MAHLHICRLLDRGNAILFEHGAELADDIALLSEQVQRQRTPFLRAPYIITGQTSNKALGELGHSLIACRNKSIIDCVKALAKRQHTIYASIVTLAPYGLNGVLFCLLLCHGGKIAGLQAVQRYAIPAPPHTGSI